MFCSKCGSELTEGAVFCQNCGEKVINNNIVQQASAPLPSPNVQQQPYTVPSYVEKRNKYNKSATRVAVIACGISGAVLVMLIFVSIIGVIVSTLGQGSSSDLSQAKDEDSHMVTSTTEQDEDFYVDEFTIELDSELCGRWRTYEGDALALDEYGNVSTVFSFWGSWNRDPDYVTWEASNGYLTLNAHYSLQKRWKIVTGRFIGYGVAEDTYELFFRDGDIPENSMTGEYFRFQDGDEGLVGVWTPRALSGTLILNEDGTGMIGDNLLIWWADETILYYYPVVSKSYDYTVSGDTLTIFFSDGSRTYTRVGK